MHTKHILLVEDDPHDMDLTLGALEEYNLANHVLVLRDGEEALDYLHRRGKFEKRDGGNPIAVLLDLKMPKVNGLEVLKNIKTDEELKIIPVVVLTSSRESRDLIECYRLGVNAYVVKPVEYSDFKKAVQQLSIFWLNFNELPTSVFKKESGVQNGKVPFSDKKPVKNEISVANSVS